MDDELLAVACMPGLSHGACRLYLILAGASRRAGERGAFFPVTLAGLARIHPGTADKRAGLSTIIKQVAELRRKKLIEMRSALHRNQPTLPVFMKVLYPEALRWRAADGSDVAPGDIPSVVGQQ